MNKEEKITKISIEYKNDADSMNKLIELIIQSLLDNNNLAGGDIEQSYFNEGLNELST